MFFRDYKAEFDAKRAALHFASGAIQKGVGCETKIKPGMPPWMVDWAVLYPDGFHFRVKEYFRPMPHPDYGQGQRAHFSYQYGATTAVDGKGMPKTASDHDTVIRIDRDQWGPHMHYGGRDHIKQESLTGPFVIDHAELFAFVEAVETVRQSGCTMEEILFFGLKKERTK